MLLIHRCFKKSSFLINSKMILSRHSRWSLNRRHFVKETSSTWTINLMKNTHFILLVQGKWGYVSIQGHKINSSINFTLVQPVIDFRKLLWIRVFHHKSTPLGKCVCLKLLQIIRVSLYDINKHNEVEISGCHQPVSNAKGDIPRIRLSSSVWTIPPFNLLFM